MCTPQPCPRCTCSAGQGMVARWPRRARRSRRRRRPPPRTTDGDHDHDDHGDHGHGPPQPPQPKQPQPWFDEVHNGSAATPQMLDAGALDAGGGGVVGGVSSVSGGKRARETEPSDRIQARCKKFKIDPECYAEWVAEFHEKGFTAEHISGVVWRNGSARYRRCQQCAHACARSFASFGGRQGHGHDDGCGCGRGRGRGRGCARSRG